MLSYWQNKVEIVHALVIWWIKMNARQGECIAYECLKQCASLALGQCDDNTIYMRCQFYDISISIARSFSLAESPLASFVCLIHKKKKKIHHIIALVGIGTCAIYIIYRYDGLLTCKRFVSDNERSSLGIIRVYIFCCCCAMNQSQKPASHATVLQMGIP